MGVAEAKPSGLHRNTYPIDPDSFLWTNRQRFHSKRIKEAILELIHWIRIYPMQTIAETSEYLRRAGKLLSDDERRDVLAYLAEHPRAGDLMEGTGGVRKLRWSRGGRGKSGGARVIYYFHSEAIPLYLLTLFAKNERSNLSKAERN
jgi:mRNA-degrading endonuclease RelE of RelBE toxin-antitoxin system